MIKMLMIEIMEFVTRGVTSESSDISNTHSSMRFGILLFLHWILLLIFG
jgi:hypothetical protein